MAVGNSNSPANIYATLIQLGHYMGVLDFDIQLSNGALDFDLEN